MQIYYYNRHLATVTNGTMESHIIDFIADPFKITDQNGSPIFLGDDGRFYRVAVDVRTEMVNESEVPELERRAMRVQLNDVRKKLSL